MSQFLGALEVLDRSGHALHRVRIERLPFRIGRALDNDLVLDDVHVSPHHAEVRDERGLVLADLGSTNGCLVGPTRTAQVELFGRTEFRLGHTQLRFRSIDETLAPTQIDPIANSRTQSLNRVRWAMPIVALALALFASDVWLASNEEQTAAKILSGTLPSLLVLLLWSLSWALVNRVIAHRFNYLGHLSVVTVGALASTLSDDLLGVLGFAFSIDDALASAATLIGAAIVAGVIFGHLRLISRGSSKRLWVPSTAMGLAFLAVTQLPDSAGDDFSTEPSLGLSLHTPSWALGKAQDADDFFSEANDLVDAVDEAAVEE